jgi:hypothetical protein
MKATEFIAQVKQAEKDTDNFYATHFQHLIWDLKDGMEEGYIDVKSVRCPQPHKVRVECEDGIVWIHKTDNGLEYHNINDEIERCCNPRTERRMPSPYERTRAMVYASGNRWMEENWRLTHE